MGSSARCLLLTCDARCELGTEGFTTGIRDCGGIDAGAGAGVEARYEGHLVARVLLEVGELAGERVGVGQNRARLVRRPLHNGCPVEVRSRSTLRGAEHGLRG